MLHLDIDSEELLNSLKYYILELPVIKEGFLNKSYRDVKFDWITEKEFVAIVKEVDFVDCFYMYRLCNLIHETSRSIKIGNLKGEGKYSRDFIVYRGLFSILNSYTSEFFEEFFKSSEYKTMSDKNRKEIDKVLVKCLLLGFFTLVDFTHDIGSQLSVEILEILSNCKSYFKFSEEIENIDTTLSFCFREMVYKTSQLGIKDPKDLLLELI